MPVTNSILRAATRPFARRNRVEDRPVPSSYGMENDDVDSPSPAIATGPVPVVENLTPRTLPDNLLNAAEARRPILFTIPEHGLTSEELVGYHEEPANNYLCFGRASVTRTLMVNAGFDWRNRPGGLPMPTTHLYLSEEFRRRIITEVNHSNRLFHTIFGTPYYSPDTPANAPSAPATTEGGDRLARALDDFVNEVGGGARGYLPTCLLYCILQQEDPAIFNTWAAGHGIEDAWATLVGSWSGHAMSSDALLHPLLNGMMVVPTRRYSDHSYPYYRPGVGMPATEVRPTFIVSGGWRGTLALSDENLIALRLNTGRRYRGLFLAEDCHIRPPGETSYFVNGNNMNHGTGFTLATPEMVEHYWTRFAALLQTANGSNLSDGFLSAMAALGLTQEYLTQQGASLRSALAPSNFRTAWTQMRIPATEPVTPTVS